MRLGWLLLVGIACAPDDDDTEYDLQPELCAVVVDRICGTDGSHPIHPDADILVELEAPAVGWTAWIDGVEAITEREATGDALILRPDRALHPDTSYTVWLEDCVGDTHAFDLRTGPE